MKRKIFKVISVVLTVVLLMSVFVTPVAAGRENDGGRRNVSPQEVQYLDAEVRVIGGQPVITVETDEGYTSYEFPWPKVALVDGREVALERQGNYFLLPTADGVEKVSVEDFQVALVAGQLVLLNSVNLVWKIPIVVVIAALKAAGVAVTAATVKAATLLIVAGKRVTAAKVHAVIASWPSIRGFLITSLGTYSAWQVYEQTIDWLTGLCIHPRCLNRTPDGPMGDMLCSSCAARWGQFWGQRP